MKWKKEDAIVRRAGRRRKGGSDFEKKTRRNYYKTTLKDISSHTYFILIFISFSNNKMHSRSDHMHCILKMKHNDENEIMEQRSNSSSHNNKNAICIKYGHNGCDPGAYTVDKLLSIRWWWSWYTTKLERLTKRDSAEDRKKHTEQQQWWWKWPKNKILSIMDIFSTGDTNAPKQSKAKQSRNKILYI